jgi:hypothetical protein
MEPFALQGVEGLDDGQGQRSQGGHALGLARDDSVSLPAERSESPVMVAAAHPAALKLVGSNGQISLGKQYAGRHVLVGWPGPSAMGQVMLGCRTP